MNADIHGVAERLGRARIRLGELPYGRLLLDFLESLSLSPARVLKYANHLCKISHHAAFDPANATKRDVERIVAWINGQPYRELIKH